MTQRSFSQDDQIAFAKLSGDYNPVHLDPLKARRTCFGQSVIHGIHVLLWALDSLFSESFNPAKLISLQTSFNRFIGIGESVQLILKTQNEKHAEIQLLSNKEQVARVMVTYSLSTDEEYFSFPDQNPSRKDCLDLSVQQLEKASGGLDLCLNQREAVLRFPNIVRVLPSIQLAELMALTRLVGMECPGLHSIFSDLNLDFSKPFSDVSRLNYEVISYDSRIRLLTQNVEAPGMTGTLRAFLRFPPQDQASYLEISKKVRKFEFSTQTALILGGSRGLGEVAGKLLAAGGSRVMISYCQGSKEAHNIVKQINQGGGNAMCFAFDVLSPRPLWDEDFGDAWVPTHLYYFATPTISVGSKHSFSSSLFQKFCNYYVSGLVNTLQSFQSPESQLRGIFYPSTIFISDFPAGLAEYVVAKSAGETICNLLRKKYPNMNIYSPRLPQTITDQTASFLPMYKKDPVPLMLENLRLFYGKEN